MRKRRNPIPRWALSAGSLWFLALLLGAAEVGLRFAGRGLPDFEWFYDASLLAPTSVFVPAGDGSDDLITDPMLVRADQTNQRFARRKPAGVTRVFFVGDSTTAGWPYLRGSVPSWVHVILQDLQPEVHLEIINAGFHGFDSRRLADVVREIVRYQPDAVVYRAGYDDYSGFRLRNPAGRIERSRRFVHSWLVLHSRLYNLLIGLKSDASQVAMSRRGVILRPEEIAALLADYQATVGETLAMLGANGVRSIVLSLPFSDGLLGPDHPMIRDVLPEMNRAARRSAAAAGALFIELRGLQPSDFVDSVHSTKDGYRRIATTVVREFCGKHVVSKGPCRWSALRPKARQEEALGLLDPEYLSHLHVKLALLYLYERHDPAKAYSEFFESERVAPNPKVVFEEIRGGRIGAEAIELLIRANEKLGFTDRVALYRDLLARRH